MSRGVKKLMQEKFPNMSKLDDISELLMKYVFHNWRSFTEFDAYDEMYFNWLNSDVTK